MGKIKILYYEPSSGFGGSSRCLKDWLIKLDRNKFQPYVAVLDDGPVIKAINGIAKEMGFDFVSLTTKKRKGPVFTPALLDGYFKFLIYIFRRVLPLSIKLAIYIKKNSINIVHMNTPIKTGLEAILAARMNGIPTICHTHETRTWSRVEKVMSHWVSMFICLNDAAKKKYQQFTSANKLITVYNGIDVKKPIFKSDLKKEFGICDDFKVVGIVGRLTKGKGQDIFLKAAKRVLAVCPNTKFLIVGDILFESEKKYKDNLLTINEELSIGNMVIFTGWREDALSIISGMDVLVQASTTFPEGFSLTCLEAMALGVPIVATDIPGASEIIFNGETGFIVERGNEDSMAKAIINIISNQELADMFAKQGLKRVNEVFDIRKIVSQIENIYVNFSKLDRRNSI